ncbi:Uncharacterised protein [Mycobacteroides abscessus subsp. abscessus]|nr:Uncharacterised protein [Mycobacteroides abscessus subsp. abscessus]
MIFIIDIKRRQHLQIRAPLLDPFNKEHIGFFALFRINKLETLRLKLILPHQSDHIKDRFPFWIGT